LDSDTEVERLYRKDGNGITSAEREKLVARSYQRVQKTLYWARGSVMVKALGYKPEGSGFETR
jgi:hypothetical protein